MDKCFSKPLSDKLAFSEHNNSLQLHNSSHTVFLEWNPLLFSLHLHERLKEKAAMRNYIIRVEWLRGYIVAVLDVHVLRAYANI